MTMPEITISKMSEVPAKRQSKAVENAPQLSSRGLTRLLIFMCCVPVITIAALFWYMPPVHVGQLKASIDMEGIPPAIFYKTNRGEKDKIGDAILIVNNESENDWTNLEIRVNKHYQIYETDPLLAGESRRYRLDRFITRTGAKFDISINPLKFVRIYARRPVGDRATFTTDVDWESVQ